MTRQEAEQAARDAAANLAMDSAHIPAISKVILDRLKPHIRKVIVVSPFTEVRSGLMTALAATFVRLPEVTILGRGFTGYTLSVPEDYNLAANLPPYIIEKCFIEDAERFDFERV